jgi:tetratricopeptide (TPR) repeat protein
MKTLKVIFLLCLSLSAFANNEKYVEAMKKNIEMVYKAATVEELQSAVNTLNRIGDAEKSKWEPYYYASFGNIMLATRENDGTKKDAYLDLAKASLDKAVAIQPNESEIAALEGFIHMIRVAVDPASRGPQYSMMAMQAFGKALAINPNNPRAMALLAQMQFGTAQFFKQEPTEACDANNKAIELFNNEKPASPLAPVWGKGMAEGMKANCK